MMICVKITWLLTGDGNPIIEKRWSWYLYIILTGRTHDVMKRHYEWDIYATVNKYFIQYYLNLSYPRSCQWQGVRLRRAAVRSASTTGVAVARKVYSRTNVRRGTAAGTHALTVTILCHGVSIPFRNAVNDQCLEDLVYGQVGQQRPVQ